MLSKARTSFVALQFGLQRAKNDSGYLGVRASFPSECISRMWEDAMPLASLIAQLSFSNIAPSINASHVACHYKLVHS